MSLRDLLHSISRHEWRTVAIVTAVVVALTSLPFLVALGSTPPHSFYTGLHTFAPGDFSVYYTYIDAAAQGDWIFRDLFTSEPHRAFNLNLFWVPVGWLARALSLTAPVALQVVRVAAIPLFFAVLYPLLALVFDDRRKRTLALLLVAFGSGIGGWVYWPLRWLFPGGIPQTYHPMDLWVTESVPFLSFYHSSHFTIGTAMLMLIFVLTVVAWRTDRLRYSLAAGIMTLLLFSFHPFHVPTIAGVLGAWAVYEWVKRRQSIARILYHLAIIALLALPSLLAQTLLLVGNPVAAGRAEQNILHTPDPIVVMIGYGFLLFGTLFALIRRETWRNDRLALLGLWAIVQFVPLYLPFFFQRRLSQGLSLPLALLTAEALVFSWDIVRVRAVRFARFVQGNVPVLGLGFLIFFGSSNLVDLGQDLVYFTAPAAKKFPYYFYLDNDFQSVFSRLRSASPSSVVLSRSFTGNMIPGFSGRSVYLGHPVETLRFDDKGEAVKRFFSDVDPPAVQEAFLKRNGITHVLWSEWEQYGVTFNPDAKSYLTPDFQGQRASLYRVR